MTRKEGEAYNFIDFEFVALQASQEYDEITHPYLYYGTSLANS